MSGNSSVLQLSTEDASLMLAAGVHLGSRNLNFQQEQYIFKRAPNGTQIIDLRKTGEKLLLAARAIAAIKNPLDVSAVSTHKFGQRAVLKFARATGATPIAGRFTPGCFTNQIQAAFKEPSLLIVNDPRTDHQPINEAAYANIAVIAFVNTDAPSNFVDIAIPCNTNSAHSVGLMWWMLAREVLRIRGAIRRDQAWDVQVDLYFARDIEAENQAAAGRDFDKRGAGAEPVEAAGAADWDAGRAGLEAPVYPERPAPVGGKDEDWGGATTADWGAGGGAAAAEWN